MDWIHDRWRELSAAGSTTWLTIAVWAAVVLGVAALIYARQQSRRNHELSVEQLRPQVAMFMEPNASDWHVIELVIRNFGKTAAHDIRFTFFNPPTVARYEHGYVDGRPDFAELQLPSELPFLAPGQEWRTVWDSALSRKEFGEAIESRFVGSLTYSDRPQQNEKQRRFGRDPSRQYQTKAVLDWTDLQPADRLESLTSHDLAKREKQKLELLRSLLAYFSYASKETRPDVLRAEIERMNRAAQEAQDRLKGQDLIRRQPSNPLPQPQPTDHQPSDDTTDIVDLRWAEEEFSTGRHYREQE